MITVKQYAQERNITIQAVHKSMTGKRKQERLEGHVQIVDGVKWLDEEAVAILDESRQASPTVIERTDKNERIEELEQQNQNLLIKVAEQADKIATLSEWKAENAVLIAKAEANVLLLEQQKTENKRLQEELEGKKTELALLEQQAKTKIKEAEDRIYNELLSKNIENERKLQEHYQEREQELKGRSFLQKAKWIFGK